MVMRALYRTIEAGRHARSYRHILLYKLYRVRYFHL